MAASETTHESIGIFGMIERTMRAVLHLSTQGDRILTALADLKASLDAANANVTSAFAAVSSKMDDLNAKLTAALADADDPSVIAAMQADVAAIQGTVAPFLPAPPAPPAPPVTVDPGTQTVNDQPAAG